MEDCRTAARGFREYMTVFCEGFFYCFVETRGVLGIMGFSITEGTYIYAPLPEMTIINLFTCGSRVLLSGLFSGDLIIWEFDKVKVDSSNPSSLCWKLITRIPPFMRQDILALIPLSGIGVGDCIYIFYVSMDRVKVAAYSLSQKSWSLLSSCSLPDGNTVGAISMGLVNVMAFEPRPNMKL